MMVKEQNYNLLEVEIDDQEILPAIRLYICDDEGKCDLNTCEVISRKIESSLEELLSFMDTAYDFQVSSPGVERKLKSLQEYKIFQGRHVNIKYRNKDGSMNRTEGKIQGISEDTECVMLSTEDTNQVNIPFNNITLSQLVFKFNLKNQP